jgi:hypothetical protein
MSFTPSSPNWACLTASGQDIQTAPDRLFLKPSICSRTVKTSGPPWLGAVVGGVFEQPPPNVAANTTPTVIELRIGCPPVCLPPLPRSEPSVTCSANPAQVPRFRLSFLFCPRHGRRGNKNRGSGYVEQPPTPAGGVRGRSFPALPRTPVVCHALVAGLIAYATRSQPREVLCRIFRDEIARGPWSPIPRPPLFEESLTRVSKPSRTRGGVKKCVRAYEKVKP